MNESDRIKEAIRKSENRVANLEEDKADANAEIAKIDRELGVLSRNIKRMNVELVSAFAVEAAERKAKRIIESDVGGRTYERQFIINAKRMLSIETYQALCSASSEVQKVAA